MSLRTALLCSVMLGALPAPLAVYAADMDIYVDTAPPPLQSETVPPGRTGYVWASGYWSWQTDHYVWVPGHWIEERINSRWVPEHWEQRGNRWHFISGHWES